MYDTCATCKKPVYPSGITYTGQACMYGGKHPCMHPPTLGSTLPLPQCQAHCYCGTDKVNGKDHVRCCNCGNKQLAPTSEGK